MQQIIDEKKCVKCESLILEEQAFCSCCGKKIKTKKKSKKFIKTFFVILIALVVAACLVGGVVAYIHIQKSYDLATTSNSLGFPTVDEGPYVYEIKNSDGDILSEVFYLSRNYYIRMIALKGTVYVIDKGQYEYETVYGEKWLVTQDENGNITRYKVYKGCLIEENCVYTGEVPKKSVFSAEFKKDYLETNETVIFNDNQTYSISYADSEYTGKYTRDGCVIEAVSDEINGSHKWVVYEGKLIDRFFESTRAYSTHADRAKYEFYKYLQEQEVSSLYIDRGFMFQYEASHPITLN